MIVSTPIGDVTVNENIWTGRFALSLDGKVLKRQGRKQFVYNDGTSLHDLTISGNMFTGVYLKVDGVFRRIYPPTPWYVYVLCAVPFVLSMVLGNIVALAQAGFYYVGGAIGGGISGIYFALGLYLSRLSRKPWVKILILSGIILASFFTCWGVGTLIVHAFGN